MDFFQARGTVSEDEAKSWQYIPVLIEEEVFRWLRVQPHRGLVDCLHLGDPLQVRSQLLPSKSAFDLYDRSDAFDG